MPTGPYWRLILVTLLWGPVWLSVGCAAGMVVDGGTTLAGSLASGASLVSQVTTVAPTSGAALSSANFTAFVGSGGGLGRLSGSGYEASDPLMQLGSEIFGD